MASVNISQCCGTLGTAVNETYFALFSMGAILTGLPSTAPFITILILLACSGEPWHIKRKEKKDQQSRDEQEKL